MKKNPWSGGICGRKDCAPCNQKNEKTEDCFKTNILYESRCTECNGTEKGKEDGSLADTRPNPSIYVAESSRSMKERSKEHWRDTNKTSEDSHMVKHWSVAHPDSTKPRFNFYVMRSFKTPLERQVAEAVRIQLRGSTLNSMGVYNRCKLTRLVVDTNWDKKVFNEKTYRK